MMVSLCFWMFPEHVIPSLYARHVPKLAYLFGEAQADAYLAQALVALSQAVDDQAKIERIQMQKYLRSFLQGGWTMYFENLRTNVPGFATTTGSKRPYRWMYPTGEYQNNADNVAAALKAQFGSDNDDTHQKTWWLN
ncbi:MAG TPA: hypothetical protein DEG09_08885 [Marinilabiliaceae bacterium]|nr:hypothetical protein [Marinilabiliaceae bacterium]HBX88713.1 hypothetical protein [Marinilabiliaceae bacterium]